MISLAQPRATRLGSPGLDQEERTSTAATLRYGPIVLRFTAADAAVRLAVRWPHLRFQVDDGVPADCEIACRIRPPEQLEVLSAPPPSIWEATRSPERGDCVRFYAQLSPGRFIVRHLLSVSADLGSSVLVQQALRPDDSAIVIGYPMDEYLATRLLTRVGAVVLHASSVIDDRNDAYLFVGHSGAGKSTIARLAEGAGARVLSDDRTIVTMENGVPYAWGTPWHGTARRGLASRARVAGVCLLVQDRHDFVRPVGAARAFAEMFVRTVQPTIDWREVTSTADALVRLAERLPVAELHFRPATVAYALARQHFRAADGAAAGARARANSNGSADERSVPR